MFTPRANTNAVFSTIAAALLALVSVQSASAQSTPLTNTDVVRLVAMRVSDQTVIAVIHEANTTRFDLSAQALSNLAVYAVSPAVIGAMRQPSAPPAIGFAVPQPSTGGAQTLAGAEIEAAKVQHAWTRSASTGVSSVASGVPAPDGASGGSIEAAGTVVKDEAYWRARVAPIKQRIRDNTSKRDTLKLRINDLGADMSGYIGDARRGGVETERQRLVTELRTLDESVDADTHAVAAIEEEGRRAGALPGWFR
jgi:hypothetical protein